MNSIKPIDPKIDPKELKENSSTSEASDQTLSQFVPRALSKTSTVKIDAKKLNQSYKILTNLFKAENVTFNKEELHWQMLSRASFIEKTILPDAKQEATKVLLWKLSQIDNKNLLLNKSEAFLLDFEYLSALPKENHNFYDLFTLSAKNALSNYSNLSQAQRQEILEHYRLKFIAAYYSASISGSDLLFLISPPAPGASKTVSSLYEKIEGLSYWGANHNALECVLTQSEALLLKEHTTRVGALEFALENFDWTIDERFLNRSWKNPDYILAQLEKNFIPTIEKINLKDFLNHSEFKEKFSLILMQKYQEYTQDFGREIRSLRPEFLKFIYSESFLHLLADENFKAQLVQEHEFLKTLLSTLEKFDNKVFEELKSILWKDIEITKNFLSQISGSASFLGKIINPQFLSQLSFLEKLIENNNSRVLKNQQIDLISLIGRDEFFTKDYFTLIVKNSSKGLEPNFDSKDYHCNSAQNLLKNLSDEDILSFIPTQGKFIFTLLGKNPQFLKSKSDDFFAQLIETMEATYLIPEGYIVNEFYENANIKKNKELLCAYLSMCDYQINLDLSDLKDVEDSVFINYISKHSKRVNNSLVKNKRLATPEMIERLGYSFFVNSKYSDSIGPSVYLEEIKNFTLEEQQSLLKSDILFYSHVSEKLQSNYENTLRFLDKLEGSNTLSSEQIQKLLYNIPASQFENPAISLKILHSYPHKIFSFIPMKFFNNQKFLLEMAKAIDKDERLKYTIFKQESKIEKLFTAFEIKSGGYFEFLQTYFDKINLNKKLQTSTAAPVTLAKESADSSTRIKKHKL